MAFCAAHPTIETGQVCHRCGQPFCDACLAELLGRNYCIHCKDAVVREMQRGRGQPASSSSATVALIIAAVGYFPCGAAAPIFSSIGLYLGRKALGEARLHPTRAGLDLARAAILIAAATLALWGIGVALGLLVWLRG